MEGKVRPETIYLQDDWIRAVYYDSIRKTLRGLRWPPSPDTLAVVEYAEVEGIIPKILREITAIDLCLAPYPAYDIQLAALHFRPDSLDVLIADQVLEHVPYPWEAVKQCAYIVKPGGLLIFGTPWLYPYHAAPKDYWRLSRDAYATLFEDNDIDVIEIGGWGGNEIFEFALQTDGLLTTNRTIAMADDAELFDMEVDEDYAIEVWAIGRKR